MRFFGPLPRISDQSMRAGCDPVCGRRRDEMNNSDVHSQALLLNESELADNSDRKRSYHLSQTGGDKLADHDRELS